MAYRNKNERNIMETVMIVMLALSIGGSIVGLIGYYGFKWLDTAYLNYQPIKAKILEKMINPAHKETYLQLLPLGKTTVMVPMKNQYTNQYYFQLEVEDKTGLMQVTENSYKKFEQGQEASVKCAVSRLSKKLMFK